MREKIFPSDNQHYEKIGKTVKCIEDEIPFEIPESWEWCRLNVIIELISRQDQPPSGYNEQNKGIPYITGASNIINGKIIINRWTETPKSISQNGDLLITCKGTVGTMTIVDCGNIHIARQIMAIRNTFNLNMDYIKLVISNEVENLKKKAKSMIPGISRKDMLELIVPLPPLEEQQNISLKVKAFEPIIDKYDIFYNAKNDLDSSIYDTLKKSILQYAIQGKLVPQDPNDEPASVLLERIRTEKEQLIKEGKIKRDKNDSYIYRGSDNSYYLKTCSDNVCIDDEIPFKIPTNWCWCSLSELITYQNGYAFSKTDFSDDASAGIPVIKSNNIMSLTVKINSKTDYVVNPNKKMMSSAIHKGDLLMCLSSQSSNTEPLGKTALYKWDEIALLNQRVLKLTPINVQITEYLYWLINSDYFHYTVSHRSGGSAQSNLKLEHVLTMAIPLPPLHEQQRIVNAINNINILLGC